MSEKKNLAFVPITSCKQCPHFKTANPWSSDGFDHMEDWTCTEAGNKKIQGAVEWHEERKIQIPTWCPLTSSKNL